MFSEMMNRLGHDAAATDLLNATKQGLGEAQELFEASLEAIAATGRVVWDRQLEQKATLLESYSENSGPQSLDLVLASSGDSLTAAVLFHNLCRETELLFDNVRNLAGLASSLPTGIQAGSLEPTRERVEQGVSKRFAQVVDAIVEGQDTVAEKAIREPDPIPERCYSIIGDLVSNREKALSPAGAVVLAFHARFLERIGAHLRRLLELVAAQQ